MDVLSSAAGYTLPVLIAGAGIAAGIAVRRFVLGRLLAAAKRTPSPFDDLVVKSLHSSVVFWGAIIGTYAAIETMTLPPGVGRVVRAGLAVAGILSVTWVLARLGGGMADRLVVAQRGVPGATLVTNIAKLLVGGIGLLIALQTLGISVTPLITALGVGALAIGLALQETLANFFAGIHILTSRQIRPGDFVRLHSGEDGYVRDVTWRYTTIHQLSDTVTIVPNAVIAGAIITNYSRPTAEVAVLVPVRVAFDSDLALVERLTVEVATSVMRDVQGGVPTFEPFIRYNAFGDRGIEFTVIMRGREIVDQHLLRHELIRRLHERFRAEGLDVASALRGGGAIVGDRGQDRLVGDLHTLEGAGRAVHGAAPRR